MKSSFCIGLLAGMNVVWAALFLLGPDGALISVSHAQTSDSGGGFLAATAAQQGGNGDVLLVVDTMAKRLAVYEFRSRELSLRGVRNIKYDMQLNDMPKTAVNGPRVSEVKKQVEEGD